MARAKQRTPQVEAVRPSVEGVANNLIDKLDGPDGPAGGTQRTAIEDLFVAIREVLSDKMLADALARQAAAPANSPTPYRTCPGCQQPLVCPDSNERLVETNGPRRNKLVNFCRTDFQSVRQRSDGLEIRPTADCPSYSCATP